MRHWPVLLIIACGTVDELPTQTTFGGERPVELAVSPRYDHEDGAPLVLMFHGYAIAAEWQERYFGFAEILGEQNFLYAAPNGTPDLDKRLFWNATDACCNFHDIEVDDVAYAISLIDDISAQYNVTGVILVGHSNGGFLANRIACESSERVDAIVTLAGTTFIDSDQCKPDRALSVLHVHGTEDTIIPYDGGQRDGMAPHPGAIENVELWAADLGCTDRTAGERIDLDRAVPADETVVERYRCPADVMLELWTIDGGGHIPSITTGSDPDAFARRAVTFGKAGI